MNGQRPLFFSGGTALRPLSQYFARQKFPSLHLITTFDSGGSTAALRKTFALPAIGDLRNRLLALADPEKTHPAILAFCNARLGTDPGFAHGRALLKKALDMSELLEDCPTSFKEIARRLISFFLEKAPADFDARGASLGNILLTASYLENGGDLGGAIAFFTSLLHVCGAIAPIVDSSLHLGAGLQNGHIIIGQHKFKNLSAPIATLFLTVHESGKSLESTPVHCHPPISAMAADFLSEAALICFPMGSFYSSVLANLLPRGAGKGVAENPAPKIFIPNSGIDAESRNMGLAEQTERILDSLLEDAPQAAVRNLLNYVALDLQHGKYPGNMEAALGRLRDMGIKIIDRPIVSRDNPALHVPEAVSELLREILDHGGAA